MKKWMFIYILWGIFFISNSSFGFTLSATSISETCSGNGSITFIPTNTNASGTITYLVYKLPNLTTPYASQTTTLLSGLSEGIYRIIATETVGTTATTQQIDITVNNNVVPLVYSVQSLNQACSSTSNINVTVSSGIGVSYEIFNGPLTFPIQSSNTFSGLPVGVYKIRVFDACGNGVVSTFTVTLNPIGLNIASPVISNTTPPSCNFIVVTNNISPQSGTVIGYPLAIQYTVNPPGGGVPIISNTIVTIANQTSLDISKIIPYYLNQSYDYSITITDACGSVYSSNFIINQNITLISNTIPISCDTNYFKLTTANFTPPFTLNFTNSPAGFNPNTFNSSYPGPYNLPEIIFGSTTNPTPLGTYDVTITDFCGRTVSISFSLLSMPPNPSAIANNNGCLTNSGSIGIVIPNYKIITAIITSAPASYPFAIPHNITSLIDSNFVLNLNPVPLGNYTFLLTDECGNTIAPVNVTVPAYVDQGLASELRPGCELNKGSLSISSLNGKLTSIVITNAPSSFIPTIPFNGNTNIASSGVFYMNGLPPGNYTFSCIDECGYANTITVLVDGYVITSSTFSLQQNCGSFNIPLNFVSNGILNESFWLQKLVNPSTNAWGNPSDNVIYTEGTIPDTNNSFGLLNATNNLNLSFNGTFRIVRAFLSFNNGSELNNGSVLTFNKNCIEVLSPTLMFNQSLEIIDVNRMPCSGNGSLDVIIAANGTIPLRYTLIEKDGLPFFFDNGNSNVFINLAPGIYVVRVEDICGNIVNRQFDVASLISLVTITQPNDVLDCQQIITGNEIFDLTLLNATILGSQSATDYTLNYYTTLANAQIGINPIINLTNFNPTTNPQTIYARLIFNQLPNCYETTSFDLIVGQIPSLILNPNYLNCSTSPIIIDASTNNLPTTTYSWSNGTVGPIVSISQIGVTNLTVIATNSYGTNGQTCTNTQDIVVTVSQIPQIDRIDTIDWTDTENSITVYTTNNGAFEYSIDEINYQDENIFLNLISGLYTVTIRDKEGCGSTQQVVWLLNYPKYFTPNGDGFNETWYIKNAQFEPDLRVDIYDRFGKLITNFSSNTLGWDGFYNGSQILSSDYWFVVHRQDGRIHKGHFSLKR